MNGESAAMTIRKYPTIARAISTVASAPASIMSFISS